MNKYELSPCPFCGGAAEVERTAERFDYSLGGSDSVKGYGCYVYCTKCDASKGLINVPLPDRVAAINMWNRRPRERALDIRVVELMRELTQMQQWVNDLQSGMYINCVYCGHRYGPGETTPVSMADALKAHIEQCPKHPMSALKADVERLKAGRWEPLPAGKYDLTTDTGKEYTLSIFEDGSVIEMWSVQRYGGSVETIRVGDYRLCHQKESSTPP